MDNGSYDDHQAYCEAVSAKESELLKELERNTHIKCIHPRMISGRYLGRVLSMISQLVKPSRILEIGTFTGYSALCLAEGLSDDGELITIDREDELQSIQTEFIEKSPFGNRISRITGDALSIIPELEGTFDLIFLDADKESYNRYLPLILERSALGTYILIDNMLWEGKILNETQNDPQTESIRVLTSQIERDSRLTQVLLPVRDGLMIIRVDSL